MAAAWLAGPAAVLAAGLIGLRAPAWRLPGPTVFLLACVAAPLCEEIIFRMGLQTWLARRGVAMPNVLTSAVFALAHAGVRASAAGLLVFFPSLLLGHVYARRGRLLDVVLLHGSYNLCWLCLSRPT